MVYLITGPKHSGKSAAAEALSRLTGARWADLDSLVRGRTGKSPRALYTEGPAVFRKAEAEALRAALADGEGGLIIAAGGGLADNREAWELLERAPGVRAVCLEVSAETAWRRIAAAADEAGGLPPFLNTPNPRETHRELHNRRAAAYRRLASLVIDAEGKSPEEIAGEIRDWGVDGGK
jgi:shikimate kinase